MRVPAGVALPGVVAAMPIRDAPVVPVTGAFADVPPGRRFAVMAVAPRPDV